MSAGIYAGIVLVEQIEYVRVPDEVGEGIRISDAGANFLHDLLS